MTARVARYPYQAAVDAYGNGGFRFADMSHRGSVVCLPSGIYAWDVVRPDDLTISDFEFVLSELKPPYVFLLGTGATQMFVDSGIGKAFADAGLGFEEMSTGAAARTYNILFGERRLIAAALIAVA
jgi:uncharacterized protein